MHLLFNVAGALLFGTAGFILFCIRPDIAVHNITGVEISIFHTFFNITCTAVMFPFAKLLVKLSGIIVPEKKTEQIEEISDKEELEISRHFDDRILGQPSVAVERANNEVIRRPRRAKR